MEELCRRSGETEAFAEDFYKRLYAEEEAVQEFVYYMEHGNFACKMKVLGYTVVDVLVWQIDHFKSWMDRDTAGTSQNGDRMALLAFDTFLKMKEAPAQYVQKMQGETGTDYEGKYQ